jgi:hypothetical protein
MLGLASRHVTQGGSHHPAVVSCSAPPSIGRATVSAWGGPSPFKIKMSVGLV